MRFDSGQQLMATVKVGEKGQIVIPKDVRKMFGIEPGSTLLLMADTERGIALVDPEAFRSFMDQVLGARPVDPGEEK